MVEYQQLNQSCPNRFEESTGSQGSQHRRCSRVERRKGCQRPEQCLKRWRRRPEWQGRSSNQRRLEDDSSADHRSRRCLEDSGKDYRMGDRHTENSRKRVEPWTWAKLAAEQGHEQDEQMKLVMDRRRQRKECDRNRELGA